MKSEIRDIFFESSMKKDFKDAKEKEAFYFKYLGFYLERYPEYSWIAQDERILGYVVASPVSDDHEIFDIQPHMKEFKNFLKDYPGHLHINCHAESRGKGVGTKLVERVEAQMREQHISGLHIITETDAVNQSFYKKLGLNSLGELNFKGSALTLMGKSFI